MKMRCPDCNKHYVWRNGTFYRNCDCYGGTAAQRDQFNDFFKGNRK